MSGQWGVTNKGSPHSLKSLIADIERDVIYGPTPDTYFNVGGGAINYVIHDEFLNYDFNVGVFNPFVINN